MKTIKAGLISDTHGLVRKELFTLLDGCSMIIHAGDVGSNDIIPQLEKTAPVYAVRGNIDGIFSDLPLSRYVEIAGHLLYVIHDLDEIDITPQAISVSAVIYGHSHLPKIGRKNGVLYVNPGSAGPKRFNMPVSMAILTFIDDTMNVEFRYIEDTSSEDTDF